MNEACVGRSYEAPTRTVSADAMLAYAHATRDTHPEVLAGARAPLLYPVVPFLEVLGRAVTDPKLGADIMRLVHGQQDMRFVEVLRPGDEVTPSGEIVSIDRKETGELITIKLRLMRGSQAVCETDTGFFVRAPRRPDAPRPTRSSDNGLPSAAPSWTAEVTVGPRQSIEYGEASGDRNPIHMSDDVARMVGLPGMILHGLCTMAMVSNQVIEHHLDGDVDRIERLSVRFSKPVLPGDALTTTAWANGDDSLEFQTCNPAGKPVITRGLAEVRPK